MRREGIRDVFAGLLVLAVGLAFLAEAVTLDIGSARRMGPGFFPIVVAVIVCGIAIALILTRGRERLLIATAEARPLFWVMVGTVTFAPVIRYFGLVPAIFLTVALSSLGDRESQPLSVALLGIGCALVAWGIFIVGLGLPIRALRFPF